mgnify:CR=1 FL=1
MIRRTNILKTLCVPVAAVSLAACSDTLPGGPGGGDRDAIGFRGAPETRAAVNGFAAGDAFSVWAWSRSAQDAPVPVFDAERVYTGDGSAWTYEHTEYWADGRTYAFETGNRNAPAAGKEQWQELIDYFFAEGNCIDALDKSVAEAERRIGRAPTRRRVVVMLPDPVIHRMYADTTATTVYWGELDGRKLDFSRNEDRIAACKWYIDSVRERFAAGGYEHVELAGFYWIREIVTRPQDTEYSYHLTRSDIMLPHIADYLHGLNCSLDWIPYYGSRGYDAWRSFGFDQVYLQPNYYWKPQNDMDDVFRRIGELGVGLELEFEPTLLAGREGSEAFRERFRAYMRHAKETGVYGSRPIAYYHGTNGFYDLWASPDAEDRELFHELCRFIVGNPLRGERAE